jgi:hypothetical protein
MKSFIKQFLLLIFSLLTTSVFSQFNGTYSIGQSGDFANVTSAIDSLIEVGVSGPVTFEIDSGTYNQSMYFTEIPGASETNRITFKAKDDKQSDVLFSNSNSELIEFNGADFITIRALSISCYLGNGVVVKNGAHHITVDSCKISGHKNNFIENHREWDLITNDNTSVDNYTTVKNCTLIEGGASIMLRSTDENNLEKGHVIFNNTITKNTMKDHDVYLAYIDSVMISNNRITSNMVTAGSHGSVVLNYSKNSNILANTIITRKRGIRIVNAINELETEYSLIANNMVKCTDNVFYAYGITLENNNQRIKLYNNSIYMLPSKYNYGAAIYVSNNTDRLEIINNNIYTKCMVFSIQGYIENKNIDYNNLYKFSSGYYMIYEGSWQSNLENAIDAGFDMANNIVIDPVFVSSTDLHATNAEFGNLGMPLPLITTDIDGEPRNISNPDIGADEFDPTNAIDLKLSELYFDNEPLCSTPAHINLKLKNIGNSTVSSFDIVKIINDTIQDTITVTQELNSYDEFIYQLNYPDFKDGDTLTTIIENINALADENPLNNTLTKEVWLAQQNDIVVGPDSNDVSLKQASDILNKRGICGDVNIIMEAGTYNDYAYFNHVASSSATDKITIQSLSGNPADVIIAAKSIANGASIENNGTDFLTVKDITIKADTGLGHAISYYGGADYNTFENLIIYADTNSNYSGIYSYDDNQYASIRNCKFYHGDNGIALFGERGKLSASIINNTFEGKIYNSAINASNIDSLTIMNNQIVNLDTNFHPNGITIEEVYGSIDITNNIIDIEKTTGSGLYINYMNGIAQAQSKIVGNIIDIGGTPDDGVYFYEVSNIAFYNNTINILGTNSSHCVYFDYLSIVDFQNNNISAYGQSLPYYFGDAPIGILTIDYNNVYAENEIISNIDNSNSFEQWPTSGWDKHSISVDPSYNGYIPCNQALDGAGNLLLQIPEIDVLGAKRNKNSRDIGAVENGMGSNFLGDDFLMCNNNYTLSAQQGASSFLWNTGQTTPSIEISQAGKYSVTFTNVCGNVSSDTIEILSPEIEANFDVLPLGNNTYALISNSKGIIYQYEWDYELGQSSDENVLGLSLPEGVYSISLEVSNECRTSRIDSTFYAYSSSIKELEVTEVKAYPNPVIDYLNLDFDSKQTMNLNINIFNINGQLVHVEQKNVQTGANHITIDMQHLESGEYLLFLNDGFKPYMFVK